MKKHSILYGALIVACLSPAPAIANAGWPTLLISLSPLILWYIGIVSILLEAAVLWHFLRPGTGKACVMSLVANSTSFIVGFILGGMGIAYLDQATAGRVPVFYMIFGSWHTSLVIMFLLTFISELGIIMLVWKYSWRRLWLPVLLMNILTYLIIEAQFLYNNYLIGMMAAWQ